MHFINKNDYDYHHCYLIFLFIENPWPRLCQGQDTVFKNPQPKLCLGQIFWKKQCLSVDHHSAKALSTDVTDIPWWKCWVGQNSIKTHHLEDRNIHVYVSVISEQLVSVSTPVQTCSHLTRRHIGQQRLYSTTETTAEVFELQNIQAFVLKVWNFHAYA